MDLALDTGRGPDILAIIESAGFWCATKTSWRSGFRDADEQAAYGSQPLPKERFSLDLATIRQREVTICTPKLDADGSGARGLVSVIGDALA